MTVRQKGMKYGLVVVNSFCPHINLILSDLTAKKTENTFFMSFRILYLLKSIKELDVILLHGLNSPDSLFLIFIHIPFVSVPFLSQSWLKT